MYVHLELIQASFGREGLAIVLSTRLGITMKSSLIFLGNKDFL